MTEEFEPRSQKPQLIEFYAL